ncbi:MAG: ankyrin repeat domain-containing protein [Elusimicrobiaceae bacterium]|nr:ankyrin repeat domain-containing protein [Elusimicrobiaceae bacterium]
MKRLNKNILPVLFLLAGLLTLSGCNKDENKEILPNQKENVVLEKGNSATLEDAIKNDDKKAIVYLLKHEKADPNQKIENGEPLLNIAARRGFAFAVEQLLKAGANVNATDNWGDTALINLYQVDYPVPYVEEKYNQVLNLLLNAGINVNIANKQGITALMSAGFVGEADDIEKILKVKADINAKDKEGKTALVWSCIAMEGSSEYDEQNKLRIVELLLAAGAKDKAEAWKAAVDGDFPKIAKTIWDSGINIEGKVGEELLLTASDAGMLETVKTLLKSGVNANTVDKNKKSALAYAVSPCGVGICDDKDAVAKVLINAGADVNMISKEGQTPLLYATYTENTEMVEFLLKSGADVNIKFNNETLLQMAQKAEYTEIVKLLKAAGAK